MTTTQGDSGSGASTAGSKPKRDIWNHTTPIVFSALFDQPFKPRAAFNAVTKRWVSITRNSLFLLLAIISYQFLLPDIETMRNLSLSWISLLYLKNAGLLLLVSGTLHLFLFTFRGQGKQLKYDPREQMDKTRKFSFSNQVHDNMFWSLVSGAGVWTLYECLYFWGVANEFIPTFEFSAQPLGFLVWLLVLPFLLSTHFYMIHRLLHNPLLFDRFHKLHHRNIHIGPWSGMSMHPVEHLFYISSVLIHFVIASHPVIVLLHLYMRSLAPGFSHAGFEKVVVKDRDVVEAADFHHQLHHRYFECNYGNVETPWDRWFGTLHDGSDEATVKINARRRDMYKAR